MFGSIVNPEVSQTVNLCVWSKYSLYLIHFPNLRSFQVHARDPPSTYLTKIRTYLDPNAYKSTKKIRSLGDSTSTQVLRNLEISLRTNNIEWVQEFLGPEHGGLDVLVDYLTSRLAVMMATMVKRHTTSIVGTLRDHQSTSFDDSILSDSFFSTTSSAKKSGTVKSSHSTKSSGLDFEGPRVTKMLRHSTKLKMGDTTDDIHVSIMCLRAIMNNKFGFKRAINCIALSLVRQYLKNYYL